MPKPPPFLSRLLAIADVAAGLALLSLDLAPHWFNPWNEPLGVVVYGATLLLAGVVAWRLPSVGLSVAASACIAMAVDLGLLIAGLTRSWGTSEGFGRLGIVVFTTLTAALAAVLLGAALWQVATSALARPAHAGAVLLATLGAAVPLFFLSSSLRPGAPPSAPSARAEVASLEVSCRANHPTACGELFWLRYRGNDLEGMKGQSGVLCRRGVAYHCFALGDVALSLGRLEDASRYYDEGCARDPAHCRRQRPRDPGPLP